MMFSYLLKRKRKRDAALEYPDYFWTVDSGHEPFSDEYIAELIGNITPEQIAMFVEVISRWQLTMEEAADSVASHFAMLEYIPMDKESYVDIQMWADRMRSKADVMTKRRVIQRPHNSRRRMVSQRQRRQYSRRRR